jgi:hypothetical protein
MEVASSLLSDSVTWKCNDQIASTFLVQFQIVNGKKGGNRRDYRRLPTGSIGICFTRRSKRDSKRSHHSMEP